MSGDLPDTDPQRTGVEPRQPQAGSEAAQLTAHLVSTFVARVREVLADEEPANTILLRGFEKYHPLPSLSNRFKLDGVCIADYPMYRGVSRLLGMKVLAPPGVLKSVFKP